MDTMDTTAKVTVGNAARRTTSWIVGLCLLLSACLPHPQVHEPHSLRWSPPRLVVLIVVDQLRADLIARHQAQFLPARSSGGVGGFRYLIRHGTYYPMAEHRVLNPVTAAGHGSLVTGTWPADHGLVLNAWYDVEKRRKVYAVEQPGLTHLGESLSSPLKARGPANLWAPTLGDTLKEVSPASQVVALSLKDRAAVAMAGRRADLALWMSRNTRTWVSSSHYGTALPDWVEALNQTLQKSAEVREVWEEVGKFRHVVKRADRQWVATAAANRVLADLVEASIQKLRLGRDGASDLLMVSLSAHDYTGHGMGVMSDEVAAMTRDDDATIARILRAIDREVPGGLEQVVVALTGDHGVGAHPAELDLSRVLSGYIDGRELTARLDAAAREVLGPPSDAGGWVLATVALNIYLNPRSLRGKSPAEVAAIERTVATIAEDEPGIFRTYTRSQITAGDLPSGPVEAGIANSYVAGRSGHIIAVPQPWFLPKGSTTHHWSPWTYDRLVPLFIAGKGVRNARIPRTVAAVDLAPTLAYLLGILPPAMSRGALMGEAILRTP